MKLRALQPLLALKSRLALLRPDKGKGSALDPRLARSHALRERIGGELPKLETLFVDISEELSILDTHCQAMLKQCDELRSLASGEQQGQSLVEQIRSLLQEPLAYIDECIASQAHLLSLVGQCQERTEAMLRVRDRMNDALAPLTYMTVLFKIESAYLGEDQRDTFITVTVEIEKLRSLVEETFNKNSELLTTAQATLKAMHQRLNLDFARQETLVGDKRQQITHAFDNLDKQVASNAERDNDMHTISSKLADEVSKIVIGLQFQDIFKQKCEQVLRGLDTYEASLAGTAKEDVSKLCHLDQAASELDGGIASIRNGVNLIRSHMEELESRSLNQDDQGSDGLVQVLLDTIDDVHKIILGMAKLAEEAHTAVKPAGQIALSMSSALTELAINMQHIALNAQVRSVWIGAGTGLEELAARTAEISNQISHISEQTSQDLVVLQTAVNEMLTAFEAFHRRGSEQLTRLGEQRTGTESRLHSLRDHTISTIHTIGSGVDAIKTSATKLNEDLVQMDEVRDDVLNNARELSSFLMDHGVKNPQSGSPATVTAAALGSAQAVDDFQDFSDFSAPSPAAPAPVAQTQGTEAVTTQEADASPAPQANAFTDFSAPPTSEAPASDPASAPTEEKKPAPEKPAPPASDFELF